MDMAMNGTINNKPMNAFEKIKFVVNFIIKVVLYVVMLILAFVFILFIAYFFDLMSNIKTKNSQFPLFNAYVIISPSMVPTIRVEDAVIIKRKDPSTLKIGDIITFSSSDPRYAGITITHRIVGIEKNANGSIFFRTKGDGNNTEDSSLVKGKDVYGKVIIKVPMIGYLQSFLINMYGWIIAIVLPCLAVIIYDIIKLFKLIRDKNAHKVDNNDVVEIIDNSDNVGNLPTNDDNDIDII